MIVLYRFSLLFVLIRIYLDIQSKVTSVNVIVVYFINVYIFIFTCFINTSSSYIIVQIC
jgi:hypothetical protein